MSSPIARGVGVSPGGGKRVVCPLRGCREMRVGHFKKSGGGGWVTIGGG
jgi:hypothetical protein